MAKKQKADSVAAPPFHPKRSVALARAQRGTEPVHLSGSDVRLLDRALAEGQNVHDTLQDAILAFGRWLLVEVFAGDATAALDAKNANPVWLELVRRAGGPTLAVSRRLLYVAVAIAANDKRVTSESWRLLDVSRKEMLLPLREAGRIRQAAQHVTKFNLTQAKTRVYVTELMKEDGKKRQVRLTRVGLVSRVRGLRERLGGPSIVRRTEQLAATMTAKERAETKSELDGLREVLEALTAALGNTRRLAP